MNKNNRYSKKSCIAAKFIDKELVAPLEAIYNLLANINNRLLILEQIDNAGKKE